MTISSIWPFGLYRVAGESMRPTYAPGDVLVGRRWFRPRVGDVVVARHGGIPLVKRIARIEADGIWLEGDNSNASIDSRHFGPLQPRQLQAKITAKLG